MKKATVIMNQHYVISQIDKRLFGSFIEHLGTTVYGGIYEPTHPTADQNGFREDVKELIRELGVTILRYPGGNFVSGYNWKDGVGPKESRPVKFDPAWRRLDTNQVGTDEFLQYAKEVGSDVMLAVNMGTGTPSEAGELVDYVNGTGSCWADQRVKNGHKEPYGIKTWCIGNEMDGPWQIGAMSPEDYAKKAREATKIMKWIDPNIESVFCGSCATEPEHKTFGTWDRVVFENAYDQIDYISLHRYYNYTPAANMFYPLLDTFGDIPHFFSEMQWFIDTIKGAADYAKGMLHSEKTVNISFDEWGIITNEGLEAKDRGYTAFSQTDTMISGGMICTLINNADRVKIANQSLLVNNGGMISTKSDGGVIKQGTFYPFMYTAKYAKGAAIRSVVEGPTVTTDHYGEEQAIVNANAYDEKAGTLSVFAINCSMEDDIETTFDLRSFPAMEGIEHVEVYSEDPQTRNTFETPDAIRPSVSELGSPKDGLLTVVLKKHSWNMLRLKTK